MKHQRVPSSGSRASIVFPELTPSEKRGVNGVGVGDAPAKKRKIDFSAAVEKNRTVHATTMSFASMHRYGELYVNYMQTRKKAFIDELANTRDLGLVASIVSMGRILGMKVVAEGVEELEQVERLKQIGCDFIQGYYYSKPLPPLEFEAFVGQGQLGVAAQAK